MQKPWWQHLHDFFLPHERNEYRPHVFGVTSVAAIAVVVLILEMGYITQVKFVFPNTDFLAAVLPGVLASLTNDARASQDVPTLAHSDLLDHAAQLAADDMAKNGYFAHVSPDGKTPWYWLDQAGYKYSYAGENLAVNFSDSAALQTAWMNSPTHRANIVKPEYTQVGFGTADGVYEGKQTTFVVEFFATPAVENAAPTTGAPVTVARTPEPPAAPSAQAGGAVLGSETPPTVAAAVPFETPVPVSAPAAPHATWLELVLASPLNVIELILTAFFALFAALMAASLVRHWRIPHPRALLGGTVLLALTFGLLAMNPILTGRVQLLTATLAANAFAATSR